MSMMRGLCVILLAAFVIACGEPPEDIFEANFYYAHRNSATPEEQAAAEKIFRKAEQIYRKQNDPRAATVEFEQAIRQSPNARFYYELGNAYIDLREYDTALRSYAAAAALGPRDPGNIYYNAACAASLKGDIDVSLDQLRKAFENGYRSFAHARRDEDLARLHSDPRFTELIERYDVQLSETERKLIGIWQNSPIMASGWSHSFAFFPDRNFIQRGNTMDCASREVAFEGVWNVTDERLELRLQRVHEIVGGELVQATGSCGSEFEIEGGSVQVRAVEPERIVSYSVGPIEQDPTVPGSKLRVTFDQLRFWKMRTDPSDY